MHFSTVADYFFRIEGTSSRLGMTELLAELLKKATPSEASIICNLSLGQLNPPYVGTQFNIAEKTITKVIADMLAQPETVIKSQAKKLGDLGLVIAQGTWRTKEDLSIHAVFKKLHEIEQVSGVGAQEQKIHLMRELFSSVDPLSAQYIVRIIIGKLRLGFSDMTIIDALSWMEAGNKSLRADIENAYNICADIGFIANIIREEGIKGIKHMHVQLGIPIRPAAAERMPTARATFEKIGPCVAQPKLDGFRLQIHVDKRGQNTDHPFFFT